MEAFVRVGRKLLSYKIKDLQDRQEMMFKYLKMKVKENDWHGVADAAMDLREIEAELKAYRSIK